MLERLQEFVGMVNYHNFIPGLTHTMAPLYPALSDKPKSLLWEVQQEAAFIVSKKYFASAMTLSFPATEAPLFLSTDASNITVGAILGQIIDDTPLPLGFFSRKLNAAEKRYSVFGHELLTIYLTICHLLEGILFTININHQPLMHSFSRIQDAWSAKQNLG